MKTVTISVNTSWNVYNYRYNLLQALRRNGYRVVIVAPYDEYSDILEEEFGEYHNIFIDSKSTNPIDDIKTTWEYYNIYKEIKPDIVLHFTIKPNIYGNFAANLVGAKMINNISGLGALFINESFATDVAKNLYKVALSKSDRVFFQNRDDQSKFIESGIVDDTQADILPGSGVDLERFKPIPIEKSDNIFRFLLIGRVLWDKGIGEYVEAGRELKKRYKNIELLIVGAIWEENPASISKEQIEAWEQEEVIRYLGKSDKVEKIIAQADCVVLPSYREGLSRALLEAGAMAKPLVATDVAGCREVVDYGYNGFLCRVKDGKDLAKKMEKILKLNKKELIEMGLNSRKKIEQEFDEKIVIQKYLKAISDILD